GEHRQAFALRTPAQGACCAHGSVPAALPRRWRIITTTVQPKGRYGVAAVPRALEAVAAV
ncbi:MAG: hypothetical protein RXO30_09390, partial [Thermoproteus sp.]